MVVCYPCMVVCCPFMVVCYSYFGCCPYITILTIDLSFLWFLTWLYHTSYCIALESNKMILISKFVYIWSILTYLIYLPFRYFLKVTIVRRLADITKELDIAVHTLSTYPEMNNRSVLTDDLFLIWVGILSLFFIVCCLCFTLFCLILFLVLSSLEIPLSIERKEIQEYFFN